MVEAIAQHTTDFSLLILPLNQYRANSTIVWCVGLNLVLWRPNSRVVLAIEVLALKALSLSILLSTVAFSAQALNFSFTGNFSADDDVQLFEFTVGGASDIVLRSYSYAGGTMADGTVIAAGGFDPILALFDSTGALIDQQDDGTDVPADPVTGSLYDTNLTVSGLAAGKYIVAIMQYDNFPVGTLLTDGFERSDPTFTAEYDCTNKMFCDVDGYNRSSFWAFDILNVEAASTSAPVPLPATLPLALAGFGALGLAARRRKG